MNINSFNRKGIVFILIINHIAAALTLYIDLKEIKRNKRRQDDDAMVSLDPVVQFKSHTAFVQHADWVRYPDGASSTRSKYGNRYRDSLTYRIELRYRRRRDTVNYKRGS